ncbi:hypothetical protein L227DRAFT_655176 [Lentinus tigrinus ALCF2SS1-6]|uniref:Uncharacterized protein n=1 Tax=Lentinus tigrinus ALCF2SS1-6 TaxID=1328759 RepID=A0A5C2S346_9APHY|nr:hypothetical protein L227DRAFT_655176 [Lentinus tigrinus ALCF2SS1-6]
MVLSLFPLPNYYAAIRTNPEAMVKDLGFDDPETLKEAQGISRKKYLVYLEWLDELPMPGIRWCRYSVCPIGTALRPPDEAQGITSDMVIPIAPNKGHTPERHPVQTTPSFPFSNCYHWFLNNVTVRVRIHGDGVEHDGAICLTPREQCALTDAFGVDCERINALYYEKNGPPSRAADALEQVAADASSPCEGDAQGTVLPIEPSAQDGDPTRSLSEIYRRIVIQRGLRTSGPPSEFEYKSQRRSDSSFEDVSGAHDSEKQSTATTMTSRDEGIDFFGWDPDANTGKIPLVDAWLDLDKHLTEDDIASPLELEKEFEQIEALITRGLARFALAQKSPEQIKDEYSVSDAELPAEPQELADDHLAQAITSLWGDLQFEYATSSSSCDPPFPVLHIPESELDGTLPTPRNSSGHGPSSSYPLPGDERFPSPDAGNKPAPSPASASDGLTPHVISPVRSPRPHSVEPATRTPDHGNPRDVDCCSAVLHCFVTHQDKHRIVATSATTSS